MGERDDAKRSSREAQLSGEGARREAGWPTQGGRIGESRERMSAIVEELMRRATPRYLGDRLKEATVSKTMEWKEKAGSSPTTMAILVGAIGAAAGALYASKGGERRRSYRSLEDDFEPAFRREAPLEATPGPGSHGMGVKERTLEKVSEAREAVLEKAQDVTGRTRSWGYRAWDEQPFLVAVGIAVCGALVALLAPVPARERRIAEPMRRKAAEGIQKLGETLEEKLTSDADAPAGSRTRALQEEPNKAIQPQPETSDRPPTVH